MKSLVIYDNTGKIYLILHGEEKVPQGLQAIFVDIPDGAILNRIDVTDSKDPQPVFSYLPDSDIGKLKKQVEEMETEVQTLKTDNEELTLALADMIGGGDNA